MNDCLQMSPTSERLQKADWTPAFYVSSREMETDTPMLCCLKTHLFEELFENRALFYHILSLLSTTTKWLSSAFSLSRLLMIASVKWSPNLWPGTQSQHVSSSWAERKSWVVSTKVQTTVEDLLSQRYHRGSLIFNLISSHSGEPYQSLQHKYSMACESFLWCIYNSILFFITINTFSLKQKSTKILMYRSWKIFKQDT